MRKIFATCCRKMFILLNGSFGIGKTTVAELLTRRVPGAAIYDPERIGYILRRLPAWTLGRIKQPPDYQDLALWRRLIVLGAKRKYHQAAIVVVPMAFTNKEYFEAFALALGTTAPVHRFCLVAPLKIIQARLAKRASLENRDISDFEIRRSKECVEAHHNVDFGTPIDATSTPDEIVEVIRRRVLP